MDGSWCLNQTAHVPLRESVIHQLFRDDELQTAICFVCHHPIQRYFFEAEEDRRARWGPWFADRLIIEELELP